MYLINLEGNEVTKHCQPQDKSHYSLDWTTGLTQMMQKELLSIFDASTKPRTW